MAESKKFYWIKLKANFFDLETIDWLLTQKNGCEYVVLYQKLCLLTANKGGEMVSEIGEMIVPYDASKISRDTKFSFDTVVVALELFKKIGLIYEQENGVLKIPYVDEVVGYETEYARKKREYREKKLLTSGNSNAPKTIAKTDAERQRAFRAKKVCEEKQHIPHIETTINNTRYGGNYYIVMRRDKFCCAMCGSIENLCVHHIDGYDKNKPENNAENKMITLCRNCHGTAHSSIGIPKDILESISYFDEDSNVTENVLEMSETSEGNMSDKSIENRDKRLENRDKEIESRDREKRKSIDYQAIVNAYNETCVSLPSVKLLSDNRKRAIKAILNKGYSADDFIMAFKKAQESDFLTGKVKEFKASFDWLIKESNLVKVLEGNYDNKRAESKEEHHVPERELGFTL